MVLCCTKRSVPVGLVSSGNFARRLSGGIPLALVFTLGTDVGAVWPGVNKDVTTSGRRLFLQSKRSSSILCLKVHANDGYLHSSHHEPPGEVTVQSQADALGDSYSHRPSRGCSPCIPCAQEGAWYENL
jgi:hypothetical protein